MNELNQTVDRLIRQGHPPMDHHFRVRLADSLYFNGGKRRKKGFQASGQYPLLRGGNDVEIAIQEVPAATAFTDGGHPFFRILHRTEKQPLIRVSISI